MSDFHVIHRASDGLPAVKTRTDGRIERCPDCNCPMVGSVCSQCPEDDAPPRIQLDFGGLTTESFPYWDISSYYDCSSAWQTPHTAILDLFITDPGPTQTCYWAGSGFVDGYEQYYSLTVTSRFPVCSTGVYSGPPVLLLRHYPQCGGTGWGEQTRSYNASIAPGADTFPNTGNNFNVAIYYIHRLPIASGEGPGNNVWEPGLPFIWENTGGLYPEYPTYANEFCPPRISQ